MYINRQLCEHLDAAAGGKFENKIRNDCQDIAIRHTARKHEEQQLFGRLTE